MPAAPCATFTIQRVQQAGRVRGFPPPSIDSRRLKFAAASSSRQRLPPEDPIPVPCHADELAMAYTLKPGSKTMLLTSMIDPGSSSTPPAIPPSMSRKQACATVFRLFATNHSPASQAYTLKELLCCLPKVLVPKDLWL